MLVVFLVKNFAPEAKGHGVPEVMDAIYYKSGVIRPMVAVVKSLASALVDRQRRASVGREGPIIQIGSALGSTLGQFVAHAARGSASRWSRPGRGAGIAATFNTPIGGVMFAIELMMPEVSVAHLPAGRARDRHGDLHRPLFSRRQPAFAVPPLRHCRRPRQRWRCCPAYAVLGAIIGRGRGRLHPRPALRRGPVRRDPRPPICATCLGMLLVGVLIVRADALGPGTTTSRASATRRSRRSCSGQLDGAGLLWLLLFACKLLATSLSLGSGSSGGIFSPSLFMGATLGGAFGGAARRRAARPCTSSVPAFAMVGMGGDGRRRHRRGDDRRRP